jgi:hypothetical protein
MEAPSWVCDSRRTNNWKFCQASAPENLKIGVSGQPLFNKKIMIIDSVPTVFIPEEMRKSSYNRFYISKLMDLLNDGRLPNNFEDVEILIYSADTKFEYSGSYMGTNKNAFRPIVTWRVKDLNSDEILSEKIIRGVPQTSISINPKNKNDFKPVYGFMPNEEVYNEIQKTLITGE